MTKTFLSIFLGCALCQSVYCQDFNDFFTNRTLRADYLFTGNKKISTLFLMN